MRLILLAIATIFLISAQAQAKVNFAYQKTNKSLNVSGTICEYGRASKSLLPKLAINKIHQQLLTQELDFIQQIKNVESGMAGNRLQYAKLALIYQLKPEQMSMNYYYEGNNSCAQFNADLLLDFDSQFDDYIELTKPKQYSFIADTEDYRVFAALNSVYPELLIDVIQSDALTLVQRLSPTMAMYKFDHPSYVKSQQQASALFFVDDSNITTKALIEYLISYGFVQTDNKEMAYWQFEIESLQNGEFEVLYQMKQGTKFRQKVTPALPVELNANTEEEKLNLLLLQLELAGLVEQLK